MRKYTLIICGNQKVYLAEEVDAEILKYKKALADAINLPKGVIPDSVLDIITMEELHKIGKFDEN